jgi:hypothetical protein
MADDKNSRLQQARDQVADIVAQARADAFTAGAKQVKDTYRKLQQLGGADILNEMAGRVATAVAQQTFTQPNDQTAYLVEQRRSANNPTPVQFDGAWAPQMVIKESGSGKEMTRWRVRNASTGEMVQYDFRHERVAAAASAFLNETGRKDDPRVKRIMELCDEESRLIVEINRTKKILAGVDPNNAKRTGNHRNELELNRTKLENVRLKLGVI